MTSEARERIKVWDIVVRSFHWCLVVSFGFCYLTGDDFELLHAYLGYGILMLLGVRVVWGVVGTKYARFSNFIYGWKSLREYVRGLMILRPQSYLGHNPLGGWMVVLLLLLLLFTCWTGLEAYGEEGYGPFAQQSSAAHDPNESRDDDSASELWSELHEVLADITLFLIFVHIAGVVVSSILHRENLVRAMWSGYKVRPKSETPSAR
jgi:cytochrome b